MPYSSVKSILGDMGEEEFTRSRNQRVVEWGDRVAYRRHQHSDLTLQRIRWFMKYSKIWHE